MKKTFFSKCLIGLATLVSIFSMSAVAFAEETWKAFDETDTNITFSGPGWHSGSHSAATNGLVYASSIPTAEYSFNFTGTKLRISSPSGYDMSSQIIIDGTIIKDSTYPGDVYAVKFSFENLANKEHSVKVINLSNDKGYLTYVSPDKIEIDADGKLLPYNESVNNSNKTILNIEPEKSTIRVNDTVKASVVIDNITEIAAEDIRITYDATKLKFEGYEQVAGIKLVKNLDQEGELRVIVASLGKDEIVNAKKVLLNLNFKATNVGEAKVDVIKARVSDGIEMEKDLTDEQCGEAIILIEAPLFLDVNKSGEFTLLDLAIDARHYAKDPKLAELSNYNTDVVVNGKIDDGDLLEIGQQMLLNANYTF